MSCMSEMKKPPVSLKARSPSPMFFLHRLVQTGNWRAASCGISPIGCQTILHCTPRQTRPCASSAAPVRASAELNYRHTRMKETEQPEFPAKSKVRNISNGTGFFCHVFLFLTHSLKVCDIGLVSYRAISPNIYIHFYFESQLITLVSLINLWLIAHCLILTWQSIKYKKKNLRVQ